MTSGAFNTEAATMAQAATRVEDVKNQIDGELRTLFGAVEGVRSHWKGAAATSFQGLMERWRADSSKLSQALQNISQQINESGKSYTASDDAGTASLKSAGSGLNL